MQSVSKYLFSVAIFIPEKLSILNEENMLYSLSFNVILCMGINYYYFR